MQTLQLQSESKLSDKAELQAAFQLFTQMSGQLETTYRQLEQRVEQLSTELAAANSDRNTISSDESLPVIYNSLMNYTRTSVRLE